MPRLFHLHIENFRGIKEFDHTFKDGLTCIIGRGDSGKTTILDAISYVLSPMHTLYFTDGDFHNCDIEHPIVIEATMTGLTEEILRKFMHHIRGVKDGEIIADMADPDAQTADEPAVTIRLKVERDLEPEWTVLGLPGIDPRPVRASERELFNCFYISEYNDRHFTLAKGTPLSSLLKQKAARGTEVLNAELIAELGRNTKVGFEEAIQEKDLFQEVIDAISRNASILGLRTDGIKASIDQREMMMRENRIALHQQDIPLRQLGKGSKRLLSLAIQLSLTNPSGIILIDEIEQGLEPDRVEQVVSYLRDHMGIQVILTTHSIHTIQSLRTQHIFLKIRDSQSLKSVPDHLQGTVLKHPSALFTKKVIVAEGATEWGLLYQINEERKASNLSSFSYNGIVLVDGNGDECFKTAAAFAALGYGVLMFCDSDKADLKDTKASLREQDVQILDCEEGLALERQMFKDCEWGTVVNLLRLRMIDKGIEDQALYNELRQQIQTLPTYTEDWWENDNLELRQAIGKVSEKSKWFKKKELGKSLAKVLLVDTKVSEENCQMGKNIKFLNQWIETP